MDRHPYVFRADPTNPPSLYQQSATVLLARYNPKEIVNTKQKFLKLDSKASFEKAQTRKVEHLRHSYKEKPSQKFQINLSEM